MSARIEERDGGCDVEDGQEIYEVRIRPNGDLYIRNLYYSTTGEVHSKSMPLSRNAAAQLAVALQKVLEGGK